MVSPSTLAGPKSNTSEKAAPPALLVPFTRAAKEHMEAFDERTVALGASSVSYGPIDVPAYGFIRGVWLEVTATGGTGTVAVAGPDAPFNILDNITLADVNGQPMFGPFSGYETYLVDKYGGYRRGKEPKQLHDFATVATSGNFSFWLYVPVETNGRDGLGALANLNGASTYKLRYDVAPSNRIYTTPPTTLPNLRVRAYLDAWTQPMGTDLRGNPQATYPPAHGTTQYWSRQTFNFAGSGEQAPKSSRVGNYIRNAIFVWRDLSGARTSTTFPSPLTVYWDTRNLTSLTPSMWRLQMAQRYGLGGTIDSAGALDTGVFALDFCHDFDGQAGYELRDGWLETGQSTRLEFAGNFGAGGSLTMLTNDVSAADEVFVG